MEQNETFKEFVYDKIEELAQSDPEAPIFCYYERETLTEIRRRVFFQDLQNKREEFLPLREKTISILAANSYAYLVNLFGALSAGCRTALLDSRWGEEEIRQALVRTESVLLLYDEDTEEMFAPLQEKCLGLRGCLLTSAGQTKTQTENHFIPEGDLLLFTSGTSGKAKIAVTPVQSIWRHDLALKDCASCKKGELWAIPVPFYHAFGISSVILAMVTETVLLIDTVRSLDRDLKHGDATGLFAVPHLVAHLVERKKYLNSVQKVITAGGRCPQELADRCSNLGICVQNGYGSSELTACAAMSRTEENVESIYFHGQAEPYISADGELVIRTQYHMNGYLEMPDKTAKVLREDGLHTGDAAYMEADGAVRLQGRISEVLVMENGEKLLVPEVEETLSTMPGVKEAAVALVENRLTAFFVTDEPDGRALMQQNVDAYNETKPYAFRIRDVRIYPGAFPRTSSGKLIRRELTAD